MKIAIVQPNEHSIICRRTDLLSTCTSITDEVEVIPLFEKRKAKQSVMSSLRGLMSLVRARPDVIYYMGLTWIVPQLIRLLIPHKTVITYDAGNVEKGIAQTLGKSFPMVCFVALLERLFVTGSDIVVVRGISFPDYFRHRYGGLQAQFFYVPDPLDARVNPSAKKREQLEIFTIAYVSSYFMIRVAKDLVPRGWELVDAIAVLRKIFKTDVRVDFLGTGAGLVSLKKRAHDAGVADLCTFSGRITRDALLEHLASADLGFMEDYDSLGYRYSVGHKVQEYMNVGLPVMTGNSPEKMHLLEGQNQQPLLFDPPVLNSKAQVTSYIENLAHILHYATLHRDTIFSAGIRNIEHGRHIFHEGVVSKLMEDVYQAIVVRLSLKRGNLPQEEVEAIA